ncbi:unnamed protein product [Lasius platythorax]|uniref:BED-type domain-containing protein n=1 Tax=Lasius platythorax TaxID=488582 RepID=A0AAV2NTC4_9HYME
MDKLSEGINKLKLYFTLKDNKIKCDFCSNSYKIILNTEEVIGHLSTHKDEYNFDVSSESSQENLKKFYRTEKNFIECIYCNEKLCNPWNTRSIVYWHLEVGHNFVIEAEINFREWLRNNYELHESDGQQCCNECKMFVINKPIYLMNHLRRVHNRICLIYMPNIT